MLKYKNKFNITVECFVKLSVIYLTVWNWLIHVNYYIQLFFLYRKVGSYGYGGKYGVQSDRKDKVLTLLME